MKIHRLLERQLKNSGLNLLDTPEGRAFIEGVNKSYVQFENEFNVLEKNTEHMLHKISISNENLRTIIESLDGFNYHVSHDLKNTLINTRSLSDMIDKYLDKNDLEKVREVVDKLRVTSISGTELVEKFLQMSKFESKLLGQDFQPINVYELIKQQVKELKFHHEFEFEFDKTDFKTLRCKELGISSLFQNLFTNAIKYANQNDDLKICISLSKNGTRKVIQFKDNGIGIDLEKNREKLFKPFVRIDNGLNQEGSGVGLFIVKKVVIEHGGKIVVESKVNQGTTWTITI